MLIKLWIRDLDQGKLLVVGRTDIIPAPNLLRDRRHDRVATPIDPAGVAERPHEAGDLLPIGNWQLYVSCKKYIGAAKSPMHPLTKTSSQTLFLWWVV